MQTQQSKTDANLNFQERERELQNHFKRIKENDRRVNISLYMYSKNKNKITSSKIGS